MAKTNSKINQIKAVSAQEANTKTMSYRAIATMAVKEAQRENKQLNIPNWYLINGELVNDRSAAKAAPTKSAAAKSSTIRKVADTHTVAAKKSKARQLKKV